MVKVDNFQLFYKNFVSFPLLSTSINLVNDLIFFQQSSLALAVNGTVVTKLTAYKFC